MIYEDDIKYKQNKKGTSLSARFEYKGVVRLKLPINKNIKEDIQRRLNIGNNDEFKDYLKEVEGLELTSLYFFNKDKKRFKRYGGIYPYKRSLVLKIGLPI